MKRIQIVSNRKGIFFREPDGTITSILPHYRGDFFIRQTHPERGESFVSTYSNSGTTPFALFVKFLLLTKAKIPPIPKSTRRPDENTFFNHQMTAKIMVDNAFPFQMSTELRGMNGGLESVGVHLIKLGGEPCIQFRRADGTHITVSIPLAQQFVKILPQIAGEGSAPFIVARDILVKAYNEGKFDSHKKSVFETIPRQREFSFAKKNRNERWKKILTRKKNRKPTTMKRFHSRF